MDKAQYALRIEIFTVGKGSTNSFRLKYLLLCSWSYKLGLIYLKLVALYILYFGKHLKQS